MPLALSLSVPIGLSPVAAEATGGLGRPDVPKPRVGRIHEGPGPGAKRAREQVAKELQKNTAQVLRARAEQLRLSWPKAGNADVALAAGRIKAAPGGLPVTLAPSGGKNTLRANDNATITVLDQKAADQLGIFGVVLTAEAERAGGAEGQYRLRRFRIRHRRWLGRPTPARATPGVLSEHTDKNGRRARPGTVTIAALTQPAIGVASLP
ncbi:hypothetical protein [Streptomyces narbonensis]